MALSASIKMNHTITCIDINIPLDDKEMVEIHNGILASCTKNAQLRKSNHSTETTTAQQQQQQQQQPSVSQDSSVATTTARLTLQERLAAAVTVNKNTTKNAPIPTKEETIVSQLAVHERPETNSDALLIQQAFDDVGLLENSNSEQDQTELNSIYDKCKKTQSDVCSRIPEVADASHLGNSYS
ncbi:MAG: hypothetical protein EXX96DRAFT_391106 [Benjaminiella poitrasii]|nr:MAG: hypothetical protein EXX96DRAFT_391106 [Benjaminiella poitrasii]